MLDILFQITAAVTFITVVIVLVIFAFTVRLKTKSSVQIVKVFNSALRVHIESAFFAVINRIQPWLLTHIASILSSIDTVVAIHKWMLMTIKTYSFI